MPTAKNKKATASKRSTKSNPATSKNYGNKARYQLFRDEKDNYFYWRLIAKNGVEVQKSKGCIKKSDALKNINRHKQIAKEAVIQIMD